MGGLYQGIAPQTSAQPQPHPGRLQSLAAAIGGARQHPAGLAQQLVQQLSTPGRALHSVQSAGDLQQLQRKAQQAVYDRPRGSAPNTLPIRRVQPASKHAQKDQATDKAQAGSRPAQREQPGSQLSHEQQPPQAAQNLIDLLKLQPDEPDGLQEPGGVHARVLLKKLPKAVPGAAGNKLDLLR